MDEREFDDFYTASFKRVTGQVYAMIGNYDEAQECVQEAYARAWAHRHKLDKIDRPDAWVRTTAHRLAISRWQRARRRTHDPAMGMPDRAAGPRETHVALVAALRQLPEAQRQAVVLHYIADLSVSDVAREVGVAEGTIKARLSRGRAALATLLATTQPSDVSEGASHV